MAVAFTSVAHSALPDPTPGEMLRPEASTLNRDQTECSLGALCLGDFVGTRTTGVGKSPNTLLRWPLRGDVTCLWAQRGYNVQDELHYDTGGLVKKLIGPGAQPGRVKGRSPRRGAENRHITGDIPRTFHKC